MKLLRRIALVGVAVYALYGLAMILAHPVFIYPFRSEPFAAAGFERASAPVKDAQPVAYYLATGRADQPLVLYFMGNVGALAYFTPAFEAHTKHGRGVAAMTYRGGGSELGNPSEKQLKADALALYDTLRAEFPTRPIIAQGYSLGTGLAVHVAAHRDVSQVFLSAPYAAMCRPMTHAARLPACWLPVQRWDTRQIAAKVTAPVLILHGTQDGLIPIAEGRLLEKHLKEEGVAVKFVPVEGADHNNLITRPSHVAAIETFLR